MEVARELPLSFTSGLSTSFRSFRDVTRYIALALLSSRVHRSLQGLNCPCRAAFNFSKLWSRREISAPRVCSFRFKIATMSGRYTLHLRTILAHLSVTKAAFSFTCCALSFRACKVFALPCFAGQIQSIQSADLGFKIDVKTRTANACVRIPRFPAYMRH